MHNQRTFELLSVIVLTLALAATATVRIVGDPTPDYVTITNAIRFAVAGDVIRVSTNVYSETFDILSKTNLTIEGRYNTNCTAKVAGTTLLVPAAPGIGPVVWVHDSSVTLIDLDITLGRPVGGNFLNGGGVHIRGKSDVRMQGCVVFDNVANGFGGGIYVTNSSLTLTNCMVLSNRAVKATAGGYQPEGRGGGVSVDNGYLEVYGAAAGGAENTIKWNYADYMGGGIYLANNSWGILSNETSDVLFNTATNGGGIAAIGASQVDILAGADVCSNRAVNDGGGVYLLDSTGRMRGASTFIGNNAIALGPNIAGVQGGGVAAVNSRFEIQSGGSVAHNRSGFIGGGLHLSNAVCVVDSGDIGYRYNFVHTNYASQLGGGIFLEHGSRLVLTNNAMVHGNQARFGGGGINAQWDSYIEMDNSVVRYNRAGDFGGGGIFLWRSSITSRLCSVHDNQLGLLLEARGGGICGSFSVGHLTDTVVSTNYSEQDGGGIYWRGNTTPGYGTLTITGTLSRIEDNVAAENGGGIYVGLATADVTSARFSGNEADHHGGALYISNATARLKDVDIEYNRADADLDSAGNGGGIWIGYGASLDFGSPLAGYVPLGNNRAYDGGGLYAEGGANVTIHEDVANIGVHRNSAARNGAGIAVENSTLTVTGNVRFTENTCLRDGGGIYALNSTVHLLGDVVVGDVDTNEANRAGRYGGGAALNGSTLFAQDVLFVSNVATSFSGGIDMVNSFLFGTNVLVSGNEALNVDAGGLYGENSAAILRNALFASNAAPGQGGGICWLGNNIELTDSRIGGNRSATAGGILLSGGHAYFNQVTVSLNRATGGGGGIHMMNAAILRSTNLVAEGNEADADRNMDGDGGGLLIQEESQALLYGINGMITAISSNHGYSGGGVLVSNGYVYMGGKAWIEGNRATNGAGIYVAAGTAEVVNAYILRNVAGFDAGGVLVGSNTAVALLNCLLAENRVQPFGWGGGMYNRKGRAVLVGCTVVSNAVSGVECDVGSTLDVGGCIAYGHSLVNISGGYNVEYSDVEFGYFGTGNFDAEPLLNPVNYHLTAWSPCRDAGWLVMSERDVDGEARSGNFDVGFDEFVDGDGDNLPDVVETDTGVWVNDADMGSNPAETDSDGDEVPDGDEWLADTDPNNNQSFLQFTAIYPDVPGSCTVTWNGGTNAAQFLEISRDFNTTSSPTWNVWAVFPPPTPSPGSLPMLFETNVTFRVRAQRF